MAELNDDEDSDSNKPVEDGAMGVYNKAVQLRVQEECKATSKDHQVRNNSLPRQFANLQQISDSCAYEWVQ